MKYFGRHVLGSDVALHLQCTAGRLVPAWPDSAPAAMIYAPGVATKTSLRVVPLERARAAGLFGAKFRLGEGLILGRYGVAFTYSVSGVSYLQVGCFDAVGGGDDDGCVVSLYHYERPHASFLVQALDGGTRVLAREPTL